MLHSSRLYRVCVSVLVLSLVAGAAFAHLLCVVVLPYSNWVWATVCGSESLAALRKGIQRALFQLGRVPRFHQTDNSTAATHRIPDGKAGHVEGQRRAAGEAVPAARAQHRGGLDLRSVDRLSRVRGRLSRRQHAGFRAEPACRPRRQPRVREHDTRARADTPRAGKGAPCEHTPTRRTGRSPLSTPDGLSPSATNLCELRWHGMSARLTHHGYPVRRETKSPFVFR